MFDGIDNNFLLRFRPRRHHVPRLRGLLGQFCFLHVVAVLFSCFRRILRTQRSLQRALPQSLRDRGGNGCAHKPTVPPQGVRAASTPSARQIPARHWTHGSNQPSAPVIARQLWRCARLIPWTRPFFGS